MLPAWLGWIVLVYAAAVAVVLWRRNPKSGTVLAASVGAAVASVLVLAVLLAI